MESFNIYQTKARMGISPTCVAAREVKLWVYVQVSSPKLFFLLLIVLSLS